MPWEQNNSNNNCNAPHGSPLITKHKGSNPNAIQDHHMNSPQHPPCQNTSPTKEVKLHDVLYLLHVGCHSSPLPTQDLGPRSKQETARDTQNGDDLHAPTSPPSPSDVPTAP